MKINHALTVKLITGHELLYCRVFQKKKVDQYEPMITISKSDNDNKKYDSVWHTPLIFVRYTYNMPIEYFWKDRRGTRLVVASGEGAGSLR